MSPLAQQSTISEGEQIVLCKETKPKSTMLWETILLAAVLVGTLSTVLPEYQSSVLSIAQTLQLTG